MTIKLSLYDFFAYTIPGALYLTVAAYSAVLFGWLKTDLDTLNNISIVAGLFLLGASYVTGIVMDTLAEFWHRLFNPKGTKQRAMAVIRRNHPGVQSAFEANDFTFLLAHLKKVGGDHVSEVERFNVYGLLLRNISLGLMMLTVVQVLHYFLIAHHLATLVLAGGLLLLAITAGVQGAKFRRWFYEAIFDAIVGEAMKAEEFFVRATPPVHAVAVSAAKVADATEAKRV